MNNKTLLSLPKEERPRERLLNVGAENLSTTELLAIIPSTGTQGSNVLEIAQEWYLHKLNGEYAIMEEPNPYAVLEAGAEDISRNKAIQRMKRMLIEDIFKGPDVYIWDSLSGQAQIPGTRNFRY